MKNGKKKSRLLTDGSNELKFRKFWLIYLMPNDAACNTSCMAQYISMFPMASIIQSFVCIHQYLVSDEKENGRKREEKKTGHFRLALAVVMHPSPFYLTDSGTPGDGKRS